MKFLKLILVHGARLVQFIKNNSSNMKYLPKSIGVIGVVLGVVTDDVTGVVTDMVRVGLIGVVGDTVSDVAGVGGVERVVTVDVGGHVGSATSARTYT